MPCKRIVILGPESTGKSTLCEALATHFQSSRPSAWVPEYAREYLEIHGPKYQFSDLLTIAKGQIALEDAIANPLRNTPTPSAPPSSQSNRPATPTPSSTLEPILFVDTDLYVMKVWSEFVFNQCDPWILDQLATRHYDGYLLCSPDLPWSFDPLREYPDEGPRETLFHMYKDLMINQSSPWALVAGQHEERLSSAIASVHQFINQ